MKSGLFFMWCVFCTNIRLTKIITYDKNVIATFLCQLSAADLIIIMVLVNKKFRKSRSMCFAFFIFRYIYVRHYINMHFLYPSTRCVYMLHFKQKYAVQNSTLCMRVCHIIIIYNFYYLYIFEYCCGNA